MSLFNVMDTASSGMAAQTLRLNVIASNLSNQNSVAGSQEDVYKVKKPVFEAVYNDAFTDVENSEGIASVRVSKIASIESAIRSEYLPDHPLADEKGYVYMPNISAIEEMAEMISASRSYENNVNLAETAKNLIRRTLEKME